MTMNNPPGKDYRGAIETELRQRLSGEGVAPGPLAAVVLVCLQCRGTSSADAHFCTKCGLKFNVLVVAAKA